MVGEVLYNSHEGKSAEPYAKGAGELTKLDILCSSAWNQDTAIWKSYNMDLT